MKKLLILLALCGLQLCSCGTAATDEYADRIEAIVPTMLVDYVKVSSFDEVLAAARVNFIVRGKIESRGEAYPHGSEMIETIYNMKLDEVYLGNFAEKGDEIGIIAPYGIIGDRAWKADDFPVFREGEEYFLLLRADENNGKLQYYPSFAPFCSVKVVSNRKIELTNDYAELIYGEYKNAKELEAAIRKAVGNISYDTETESFNW